ncbi:MAG: RES family NAD+ phosphorylase [Solirubrobacterales bacterium]
MTAQQLTVAFRLADFGAPMRSEPSRAAGRFHRSDQVEPTQYACLHPLGPWAEYLRAHDLREPEQVSFIRQRVWALRVDLEPLTEVTFENAELHGISPAALVGRAYRPCQALADRLRAEGARGLMVPSAALPGTKNIVLFGARQSAPYLVDPVSLVDVPASLTAERARPMRALAEATRFRNIRAHPALRAAQHGKRFEFREPPLVGLSSGRPG